MSCSKQSLAAAPNVERIGNAQEFELMKISVGGSDIGDSVFLHEGGDLKIVKSPARYVCILAYEFAKHFRMS